MTTSRWLPHTTVLDGKLYVLGGLEYAATHGHGWIEVFDPILNKWEQLPNPPLLAR